jgi:hypothetical protein
MGPGISEMQILPPAFQPRTLRIAIPGGNGNMKRRLSVVAAFKMIVLCRFVGNQSVTFRNMKKSVS